MREANMRTMRVLEVWIAQLSRRRLDPIPRHGRERGEVASDHPIEQYGPLLANRYGITVGFLQCEAYPPESLVELSHAVQKVFYSSTETMRSKRLD